jgi:hypothetical protein
VVPFLHLSGGQRKCTEDTHKDKLSLIPDFNSGMSCYESVVTRLGRNFLFTLELFEFCAMLLTRDIYPQASTCHLMGHSLVHMLLFNENKC